MESADVKPIRVLMVDDHADFVKIMVDTLLSDPRLEIVGYAHSGQMALDAVSVNKPDLVLMDYVMPEMNGIEATRRIKSWPDAPRVIILTMYDLPVYRDAARAVRADGFVTKAELSDELLPLIFSLYPDLFDATDTNN